MKYLLSFLMLLAFTLTASADINAPVLFDGSHSLKVTEKESGKYRWKNTVVYKKVKDENGQMLLSIRETGAGLFGKDNQNVTWVNQTYAILEGTNLAPYSTSVTMKDSAGKVVLELEKAYDRKTKKVSCTKNGKDSFYDFYNDLVDKDMVGIAMMNYPFDKKEANPNYSFHLLTHEPAMYKMDVKFIGTENLTINGKAVSCYKIQMIPDLGLMNVAGAFVPKTYFWYEAKAPHNFVRYEGLESGLGTPYIVMDSVK
jgi:hypothetical protein